MHFEELFPGSIWLNQALFSVFLDNLVHGGIMDIDIDLLELIGNLFAAPMGIILFYLKDQFLNIFGNWFSTGRIVLICPESFDEPTLPIERCLIARFDRAFSMASVNLSVFLKISLRF